MPVLCGDHLPAASVVWPAEPERERGATAAMERTKGIKDQVVSFLPDPPGDIHPEKTI